MDKIAAYGSAIFIFGNMLIVVYSVVARMVFRAPIAGLTDLVGFISGVSAALAFGYTEMQNSYIKIDLFKDKFPPTAKKILNIILELLSAAVMVIVIRQFIVYGLLCIKANTVTWVMYLPFYPLCFLLAFGFLTFLLTIVSHLLNEIFNNGKREEAAE